ncbi:hypothetical protein GCM10016234_22880 [Tianweitania populi]|uniref:Uncharacterized protein n=1 Tax=Tianweitania populi TaxID=1607949 RepID=A0A8J3GKR8_9HYPH|nr:hypothetical protein GCM10016234_22880 [Tianweitania populi]
MAVALEAAQCQGHHALRDALERSFKLAVAARAGRQFGKRHHRPLLAKPIEDHAQAAILMIGRSARREVRNANIRVRVEQNSAFLCGAPNTLSLAAKHTKKEVP